MQIYSPLMAFNAGTPILLCSRPPETTGWCDIGRMRRRVSVKQDILRPRGCEHRRTETLSSSLSSFFSFYSLFNKGIMVIAIEINKRYRYDEIRLPSEGWVASFLLLLTFVAMHNSSCWLIRLTCSTTHWRTPVTGEPQKPPKIGKTAPWYLDNGLIINSEIL